MTTTETTQFVIIAIAAVFSVGSVFAADETGELLRDDYVVSGFDGKLAQAGDDKWLFEFEMDYSDGSATLKAGRHIGILKSATLEKMVDDSKQRPDSRYRLWGKITKFEDKNYIFATYFLPLRKPEDRRQKTDDRGQKTEGGGQNVNSPNDVLPIPDEIVARLQTSEVLPADQTRQAGVQLKQDSIFANRAGFVTGEQDRFVFQPDGLGRGIEGLSLELLPCQKLQDALVEIKTEPNPVRFNVAGIVTSYQGRQYLLLQKITRAYSYGNFGR